MNFVTPLRRVGGISGGCFYLDMLGQTRDFLLFLAFQCFIKGSLAQKLPIYERHLSKVKSSRVVSSRVVSSRVESSRVVSSRVG